LTIASNALKFNPNNVFLLIGVDMDCPKCGSRSARVIEDHTGLFLKCFCGVLKLLQSKYADGGSVDHIDIDEDVTLPKKGTKLMITLGALYALEPSSTGEITELVNIDAITIDTKQSNSDIASQLTILRYKGLCEITEYRRGVTGGSTWRTTEIAKRLIGK
jgi:hypothetical protein